MIYVSSDWHGCTLETIERLLSKAGFGEQDFLYVLGDVIDRGDEGVSLLVWLMEQPNIQLIMGNHENMLLSCSWLFEEITDDSLAAFDEKKMELVSTWMLNGAEPTIAALRKLSTRSGAIGDILDYIQDAPLYEVVSTNDMDFLLTHAGLGNYAPGKKLSAYSVDELLWNRPCLSDVYMDDIITVFGHTPVKYYDAEHRHEMLKTKTWINIDTGSGHGGLPCLLRLDDLKAFYIQP